MGTQEAARHTCGFFIAQHGRLLLPGVWEHPCEQIAAIDARVKNPQASWWGRCAAVVRRINGKETGDQ